MLFASLFLLCFFHTPVHAKNVDSLSMLEFQQRFPHTKILQCTNQYTQKYNPFPLYPDHQSAFPPQVTFQDVHIMTIPNALIYFALDGYSYINNIFIKESELVPLNYTQYPPHLESPIIQSAPHISGTVAVLLALYPYNYSLYIFEILSQLALLEIHHIDYDYLCIPIFVPFMKELLDLWDIDPKKIIPFKQTGYFHADKLIFIPQTSKIINYASNSNYYSKPLLAHTREKILPKVIEYSKNKILPKKIFISRKDAKGKRSIPNEDEIFALFQPYGYQQISLTPLRVIEKIALFYNAESIISFVGSGSTNIMFCKPGTQFIEITQQMIEASFYHVADMFDLKYSAINDSTIADLPNGPWAPCVPLSPATVKEFLAQHGHEL